MEIEQFKKHGAGLENILKLRYAPIAFALARGEEDFPEQAIRPLRDMKAHIAMCQAFAMVRRQRKCIAMTKEDNWCVWATIGFGLAPFHEGLKNYERVVTSNFIEDREKARQFFETSYPRLETGKYAGFMMAPLSDTPFVPHLVLIYLRPSQLRSVLMAVKFKTGALLESQFDSIDSCVHSTIPALKTDNYRITVPDPGEYERALTDEDEMIFTVPAGRLGELMDGLNAIYKAGFGYERLYMEMKHDFPRPQFYDDLNAEWGLDRGEVWSRR